MQIPPSTSLLHALSRPDAAASSPVARKVNGNEAARAAARAVFAQINNVPAVPARAAQAAPVPATQGASPVLPSTPPTKPMPRGSLLNILV